MHARDGAWYVGCITHHTSRITHHASHIRSHITHHISHITRDVHECSGCFLPSKAEDGTPCVTLACPPAFEAAIYTGLTHFTSHHIKAHHITLHPITSHQSSVMIHHIVSHHIASNMHFISIHNYFILSFQRRHRRGPIFHRLHVV